MQKNSFTHISTSKENLLFQKDFINMASVGAGCDDMPPYVSIQNFTDDWGNNLVSFA